MAKEKQQPKKPEFDPNAPVAQAPGGQVSEGFQVTSGRSGKPVTGAVTVDTAERALGTKKVKETPPHSAKK